MCVLKLNFFVGLSSLRGWIINYGKTGPHLVRFNILKGINWRYLLMKIWKFWGGIHSTLTTMQNNQRYWVTRKLKYLIARCACNGVGDLRRNSFARISWQRKSYWHESLFFLWRKSLHQEARNRDVTEREGGEITSL